MTILTHGSPHLLLVKITINAEAREWPIQMKSSLAVDLASYIWLL